MAEEDKNKKEQLMLKPLVLVLAGTVFSYLGFFYFIDVFPFNIFLMVLGFALPVAAVIYMWKNRGKF